MRFLLRTISLSYFKQHLAKTLLTLLGVSIGVATYSSIRSAQETLIQGIRSTIDRIAGKAQLQITMEGGVPEEVQERIRELPGIRATSPVIEQIVTPEQGELGSLLVTGVDLLGDREMRDYSFDGEDVDIDDPLLFLAQPDSAVFTRQFAQRARLKTGDSIDLRVPKGKKRVVVRGLLTPKGFAEAFGGNLMMVDVYAAQTLFGRGRRFDRLDVRLNEGTTIAQGTATLQQALGPAYRIETPEQRGEQTEQYIAVFVSTFDILSFTALAIGIFLIFNAFNVAVNRRRRDIGTMRALGATPRQVQVLFLAEALVIGVAGSAIGCLAGTTLSQSFLQMMGQTTEKIYGVTSTGIAHIPPAIVLKSMILGVAASLAGAWKPALAASRISPTEAFAKGAFQARTPVKAAPRIVAGIAVFSCALLLALFHPYGGNPLILSVMALGGIGLALLVGPLTRAVLFCVSPLIAKLSPVEGRLSSDALLCNPGRTTGTVMVMALSLTFVLGLAGDMESNKKNFAHYFDNIFSSDIYVRSSANFTRPDFLFPGKLREELRKLPGVKTVNSYRVIRPMYRGQQIAVSALEVGPEMDRTRYEFIQGNAESMRRGMTREGKCYVSDNFLRRYGLGVGQEVELATPSGVVRFPIAAVVRDFSSEHGGVCLDRAQFLRFWKDDRVTTFNVLVVHGADVGQVRDAIRKNLAGRFPSIVSTSREFSDEVMKSINDLFALSRAAIFLVLIVSLFGIVTSLLISVVERTREIGILKALGALPSQIARSVVVEALLLALVGLLLAIPAGNLFAFFLEDAMMKYYNGWYMSHYYPWEALVQLLVALPLVSVLAAWIPARQAARLKITEAIEYE